MRKVPSWKVDGYCDFSSTNAFLRERIPATLESRIGLLLDETQWHNGLKKTRRLFQSHLLVEYLCVVRGMAFEQLIDPTVTEKDALREMVSWYKQRLRDDSHATISSL